MTGRQRYLMLCKYSAVLPDFRKTYNGLKAYVLRGFSYEEQSLYFFDIINTIAMCLLRYSLDKDQKNAIQREFALLRKIIHNVHVPIRREKKTLYKKNPPINKCAYCKKEKKQYLTNSVFGKICENCREKIKKGLPVFDFIELFYEFSENDCVDAYKMYADFLEYSGKEMKYLSFALTIRYNYKNIKTIRKGRSRMPFFIGLRRKDDIKNDY